MTEFNKENTDDWKEKLRSAFISAFSGNLQENIQVYTEVGYYYIRSIQILLKRISKGFLLKA